MRNLLLSSRFNRYYPLVWIIGSLALVSVIIQHDLSDVREKFASHNIEIYTHISDRVLVAEAALEGFAAFVSLMDGFDHAKATEYARNLLARYPFLYMLEVAERVAHEDRLLLEQRIALLTYPGFHIRQFDYAKTQQWIASPTAEFYYPIIFQAPLYLDERNMLGLDLNSSDFLVQAMELSYQQGMAMATKPFVLAEGKLGYVIHRTVSSKDLTPPKPFTANRYVMLALRSQQLFSDRQKIPDYLSLSLKDRRFLDEPSQGTVFEVMPSPEKASAVEKILLPQLVFEKTLEDKIASQPYVLNVSWQLGWTNFSLVWIGFILFLILFFYRLSVNNARAYFNEKLKLMDEEGSLYYMANFDALTGLANRHRLNEFLESEILRAKRNKTHFSLIFIDIDDFKPINDQYGHTVGDCVLVQISNKLSSHLREDELLARFGGDEFILVSNQSLSKDNEEHLIDRLLHEFDSPIKIGKNAIQVSLSVGVATYPEDGKNLQALISVADERMYENKGSGL